MTRLRTGVATVACALVGALAPVSASAATTIPAPLTWAAFTNAPAWNNPMDNVQWYVASPVITKAMIGKKVTLTATSPRAVDCAALGAGYAPTATTWTGLSTSAASCTPTTVTWTFRPTKAMVGHNVFLNAWSAVPAGDATVTGTVTIGRNKATAASTARRPATKALPCAGSAPIGPLVTVGDTTFGTLQTASAGVVNEVWFNGTCYVGPVGQLLDDSGVLMYGPGDIDPTVTAYDPSTHQRNTWSMPIHMGQSAAPTITSTTMTGSYYAYLLTGWHSQSNYVKFVTLDGGPSKVLRFATGNYVSNVSTVGGSTTISYYKGTDQNTTLTCTADLTTTDCPATFA